MTERAAPDMPFQTADVSYHVQRMVKRNTWATLAVVSNFSEAQKRVHAYVALTDASPTRVYRVVEVVQTVVYEMRKGDRHA